MIKAVKEVEVNEVQQMTLPDWLRAEWSVKNNQNLLYTPFGFELI